MAYLLCWLKLDAMCKSGRSDWQSVLGTRVLSVVRASQVGATGIMMGKYQSSFKTVGQ